MIGGGSGVPELPQDLWSSGSLQLTLFPLKWPEAELPYRNLGLEKLWKEATKRASLK